MSEFNKIFRASQVAELDRYTIDNVFGSRMKLMENAVDVFVEKLLEFFPEERFWGVVAGPGNNGADGFLCASFLKDVEREVVVYDVNPEGRLLAEREKCRRSCLKEGVRVVEVSPGEKMNFSGCRMLVDALFGSGLDRPVKGFYAEVIEAMNDSGLPIVALDMPSGLMGEDNERNDGAIVRAARTVSFQFPKLSLLFPENYLYAGDWMAVDIGLDPGILRETPSPYYWLDRKSVAGRLRMPGKFAHKGTQGHTLLIAGSDTCYGAAVLAALGATHSGAGLVTVRTPAGLRAALAGRVPEALVEENSRSMDGGETGCRFQSVAIGPGIGTTELALERLKKELEEEYDTPMVLDADALNLLAANPELWECVPEGAILTPHPKEFERLAGKSENNFDRLNKLSTFAQDHGVIVVLKGAHTVIASWEGNCYFNTSGTPGMAKGGSGDVLTGVIAALLASGHAPLDAAIVGVFAHGLAGEKAAGRFGVRGMNAGDIAEALGAAWKELEECETKDRQ